MTDNERFIKLEKRLWAAVLKSPLGWRQCATLLLGLAELAQDNARVTEEGGQQQK